MIYFCLASLLLLLGTGAFTSVKTRTLGASRTILQLGKEHTVVLLYHKPPNVIVSHSNKDEEKRSSEGRSSRRNVYDEVYSRAGFVPCTPLPPHHSATFEDITNIRSKLHAIGRLDVDTTGCLLLTNDGALVHHVTNPTCRQPILKEYRAQIMGRHNLPEKSEKIVDYKEFPLQKLIDGGVELSGGEGIAKPVVSLRILSHPTRSTTLVSVTISEGKNRQVRRMFHSVGSGVMKLHRVSVGRLGLAGLEGEGYELLEEGQWRILSPKEIEDGLGWTCRDIENNSNRAKRTSKPKRARGKKRARSTS
ncbi:hypothetical protein THAOC_24082 [Thalassiosira oceanica]|uniref:Pseudouridine synthase RsuA/RluA-like domain-containing protein n=1 Tax=Thalassiosira oceanica TaxID=159749 RepID=K0S5A5_THAOC|nr:hypothetical protein THAOC_24082 [Thalassiosira oceanica]|mmetsp:Transcript_31035/g.74007  ORF Transcript_31035/g.74007 Transcript_31035/m.74007 type:complete len:306 (-) Transcript_31035:144-1061(-)|eukprot:EJK56096.1 hypothetical protein THAOC_24082 [Thalassiosira oceanica]